MTGHLCRESGSSYCVLRTCTCQALPSTCSGLCLGLPGRCAFPSVGLPNPRPAFPVQPRDLPWMFGPGGPLLSLVLLLGAFGQPGGVHGVSHQSCTPKQLREVHTLFSLGLCFLDLKTNKHTKIGLNSISHIGPETGNFFWNCVGLEMPLMCWTVTWVLEVPKRPSAFWYLMV